jgi:uncharacterized repeat protein (TIGR03803 family)
MKSLYLAKNILVLLFLCFCFYVKAQKNILYGTTLEGGKYGKGCLFSYDLSANKYTVIINFDSINGANPSGNFVLNPKDGLLYNVAENGGKYNDGVLFSFNPTTEKDSVLYEFGGNSNDAIHPQYGALALYGNKFYGNSYQGGVSQGGAMFSFDPSTGKDSVLISFSESFSSGISLTMYKGIFYSMTNLGGDSNAGTIYSYNPLTGKDSVLYSFTINGGEQPNMDGFTINPKNNLLYGMTQLGGTYGFGNGNGVIFSFDPATGKDSTWVIFNGTDGMQPQGNFTIDNTNGLWYATTNQGGIYGYGEIFSFDPNSGKEKVVFSFQNEPSGEPQNPNNDLVYDSVNNMFYGDAEAGGANNYGAIFSFNPVTDTIKILHDFIATDGAYPYGSMYLISTAPSSVINVSEIKRDMTVYPNPFSSYTNVVFNESGIHYIELYDVTGRLLKTIESSSRQFELFREDLVNGMYFIKVYDSEHKYLSSSKLIVQ